MVKKFIKFENKKLKTSNLFHDEWIAHLIHNFILINLIFHIFRIVDYIVFL